MQTLLKRFKKIGPTDRLDTLPITPGQRSDYLALKAHHYRSGHPATMSRVLVVRDEGMSAVDRFLQRQAEPVPIAVLVESLPVLSCRLRETALNGRYGHLEPKGRSALLNEELRTISRVIVDPRYRGLGLAVRLVRHALATATTRYTEAMAVMGRVSPFFSRAGMIAYERPPLEASQRCIAALRHVGIEPAELTRPSDVIHNVAALTPRQHQFIIGQLRRWYRAAGGRSIKQQPVIDDLIHAAQRQLLSHPIYYLHENTHVHLPSPTRDECLPASDRTS